MRSSGLRADAFTANPLLGADALAPLIATGATVFILVRTSNPGAADVQDLAMADGRPLWEHLAVLARSPGHARAVRVGAASAPARHLARARELMPRATFLLPGIGAQGGRVEDLAAAFAPGRAGGLVAAVALDRRRPRGARGRPGRRRARGGGAAARARLDAARMIRRALRLVAAVALTGPASAARGVAPAAMRSGERRRRARRPAGSAPRARSLLFERDTGTVVYAQQRRRGAADREH